MWIKCPYNTGGATNILYSSQIFRGNTSTVCGVKICCLVQVSMIKVRLLITKCQKLNVLQPSNQPFFCYFVSL